MATFMKNIGNARWNGLSADLYENKNGSATIRFDKNLTDLPRSRWMKFENIEQAENFISRH